MRSAYEPVKRDGLIIESEVEGTWGLPKPTIYRSPEECGPVDLVIVCWKTTANAMLAEALPPLLHEGTRVLSFQNGMGNAEAISQYVEAERVFIGLCFICVMMNTPGRITHLEGGDIQFAPFVTSAAGSQQAQDFAALFAEAGIKTRAFDEAEKIQWCKLCWNIPFNGLCLAHGGISVKQLFTMPEEVERARRVMEEVFQCAKMRGYDLPRNIVENQMERTAGMGDFVPSSAVDYLRGRQVEYYAIWGATLDKAHEINAPVPEWEGLARQIRQRLETSS